MPYWSHPLRGFLVPDQRFSLANVSAADSSYTEASPRPAGVGYSDNTRSRVVLELTGDQAATWYAKVTNPGFPQLGRGLRVFVGQDTTPDYGYHPPNHIERVDYRAVTTTTYVFKTACTLPDGRVLIAENQDPGLAYFSIYDPRGTTRYDPSTYDALYVSPVIVTNLSALCLTRDGRVLWLTYDNTAARPGFRLYSMSATTVMDNLQSAVSTMTLVADNVIPATPATYYRSRLYEMPNGDLVLAACGATQLRLYASQDGGASWSLTYTSAALNCCPDVILTASGKLIIVEAISSTYAKTVGSGWEDATNVGSATIDASIALDLVGYADPNGRVYVIFHDDSTDSARVSYSDDDGASWTLMRYGCWYNNDTAQRVRLDRAMTVHAQGYCCLWTDFTDAATAYDTSNCMVCLGGYSNVEIGQDANNASDRESDRIAFGARNVTNTASANFWGSMDPSTIATWTKTGAATGSTTTGWRINVAASQEFYSTTAPPTTHQYCVARWRMALASGGSLATASSGVRLRLSDGVNARGLQFRFLFGTPCQTTIVNDAGGSTISASYNLPAADTEWLCYIHIDGDYSIYVRAASATDWTLVSSGTMTSSASATSYINWGAIAAASTSDTVWQYFHVVSGPGNPGVRTNSSALLPFGRLVTGYPVPLPGRALVSGTRVGDGQTYLRAKDGPGQYAELVTLPVQHDYPVDNCFWQVQPSPRTQWRSTSTAQQIIGWTPTASTNDTSMTRHIGIYVGNVNWRTAVFEAWDGAAWQTLGTIDLRINSSALTYTRTGDTIRINGGNALGRYIWKNELVGAVAQLDGTYWRRITAHTEGIWSSDAGKHVEFRIALQGSEPASGSGLYLQAHSGLLVIHGVSAMYDKYRLRIPSQTTPDNDLRTGVVVIGYVQATGQQHDWGSRADYNPQADASVSRSGVSRVRETGPVRRSWSWAWSEGVDLSQLRLATGVAVDWVAESSGVTEAMANRGDVPYLLGGLLDELRSGEVPVVCIGAIPTTSGTTITDPTLLLYGRIASSIGVDNVQGDEGSNEVHRVQQVTIEEIV